MKIVYLVVLITTLSFGQSKKFEVINKLNIEKGNYILIPKIDLSNYNLFKKDQIKIQN